MVSFRTSRLLMLLGCLLAVLLSAGILVAGCGGEENTPEGAVQKFLQAWADQDWSAYKQAVAPARRKLNEMQEKLALDQFKQMKVSWDDVGMKAVEDKKDPNKATVDLVSGKVTITARIRGKNETNTFDLGKEGKKGKYAFDAVKVNGVWYVDQPLGLIQVR